MICRTERLGNQLISPHHHPIHKYTAICLDKIKFLIDSGTLVSHGLPSESVVQLFNSSGAYLQRRNSLWKQQMHLFLFSKHQKKSLNRLYHFYFQN